MGQNAEKQTANSNGLAGQGGRPCNVNTYLLGVVILVLLYNILNNNPSNLLLQIQQGSPGSDDSTTALGSDSALPSKEYKPSQLERFVVENSIELGYQTNTTRKGKWQEIDTSFGCNIWKRNITNKRQTLEVSREMSNLLDTYMSRLEEYYSLVDKLEIPVKDIRLAMGKDDNKDICKSLRAHPDGLDRFFAKDKTSMLSFSPQAGFIEPLLTPMRHPRFCFNSTKYILDMDYLIHDFEYMCRHSIHRTSRTVLVDMGASLDFHFRRGKASPAVYLTSMYQKFGILFDHIYAYEIKKKDPDQVFQIVPDNLRSAYHWINIGVNTTRDSHANPLTMILNSFNQHDFIVIKLDIDTPQIELPLAEQMLENVEDFAGLVDAFYFEHHVALDELKPNWKKSMGGGSVHDTLHFFSKLRHAGIPAHFWV
jgi:hypothetical protein